MEPTPPIRITPTNQRDQNQGKCSGLIAAVLLTQKAPARPAINPATKKFSSLYQMTLIPRVSAAISLSRIAIQALPTLERRRLETIITLRVNKTAIKQ